MSDLIALDVALLPPPDVAAAAIEISAALPAADSHPLRLDSDHRPHVTLMQLFARVNELERVLAKVDETVAGAEPLHLRVTGGARATSTVAMAVEKTSALVRLHERLMDALRGLERPDGGTGAFFGDDARLRDVLWVTGYRLKSSLHHYEPHITLGHSEHTPNIEPFSFVAEVVAVCHLGRYCTCRRVLKEWRLR